MVSGRTGVLLFASIASLHALSAAKLKPSGVQPSRIDRSIARHQIKSRTSGAAVIGSQSQGPTAFIVQVNATVAPANSLASVQFTVAPKPGSVTRPISATYSANYLRSRTYFDPNTGNVVVPVFGLYANFANSVTLTFSFTDNTSQQNTVTVTTPDWTDTCGVYKSPVVLQARTAANLSYDYVLLKNPCGSQSPVIIDSDGEVRWIGSAGFSAMASMFFGNAIFLSSHPPTNDSPTAISRIDLDGIVTLVHNYNDIGVTWSGHHNADPGRDGMLFDVNTTTADECVILEVDTGGNLLNTWNFADIISQAMTAGGDDPSQFVGTASQDWFHNNSAFYRKSDNTLIVSSRENFVIAVDYDTQQIKWILGDPTKQWYQFPSLRQYALTLDPNSLPPIGQHAVSITYDDNLLLFDDGLASGNHTPAGASRDYSAPRKYRINTQAMTATEIWNYPNGQTRYSGICSSVYEDAPSNYVVDYSNLTTPGGPLFPSGAELLGLNTGGDLVFDYSYPSNSSGCSTAWNAIQIHLEALRFTSVQPLKAVSRKMHGTAGTFDIDLPLSGGTGIECRAGDYQIVVTFAAPVTVTGATVTPGNGGTGAVLGQPVANGNNVTVTLTGVSTAQTLNVNLLGVSDGTNTDNVSIPFTVLVGDTTENGAVNSSDIAQTQSQSGQPVTAANFREDVTANGTINSSDVATVQAASGTALP